MPSSNSEKAFFSYSITKKAQKQLKKFSPRDQKAFTSWIEKNLSNVAYPSQLKGRKLLTRNKDIRIQVNRHLRLVFIIDEDAKSFKIIRFMRRSSNNYSHTKTYLY